MTDLDTQDPSTPGATAQRQDDRSRSRRAVGDVERAVQRDLREIKKRDASLADSALAASALALAHEIDTPGNSATSKSMCARVLLDTLETLRGLAPAEDTEDDLDRLTQRRTERIIRQAQGAKN